MTATPLADSTKRALRTLFQGLVAFIAVLPTFTYIFPANTPVGTQLAALVAATAVVSKVLNALEDKGLVPLWLRESTEPTLPALAPPAPTLPAVQAPDPPTPGVPSWASVAPTTVLPATPVTTAIPVNPLPQTPPAT